MVFAMKIPSLHGGNISIDIRIGDYPETEHRNLGETGTLMPHTRVGRRRLSVRDEEAVLHIVCLND
jgi:hypothetical protein